MAKQVALVALRHAADRIVGEAAAALVFAVAVVVKVILAVSLLVVQEINHEVAGRG